MLKQGEPRFVSHGKHTKSQIVVHWTGGLRDAVGIAATLRRRKLGVHFTIAKGKIYQWAELDDIVYHASGVNDIAIGIEIRNPAWGPLSLGWDKLYDVIHGRKKLVAQFKDDDVEALMWLLEYICERTGIPRRVPKDLSGNIVSTRLHKPRDFVGVLGHYHVSVKKFDPGTHIMRTIDARFRRDALAGRNRG